MKLDDEDVDLLTRLIGQNLTHRAALKIANDIRVASEPLRRPRQIALRRFARLLELEAKSPSSFTEKDAADF